MKIAVKVVPNASRDQVVGWLGQELKVRVAAPPEAGKANERLCRLLAQFTGLAQVSVLTGHGSARKIVELRGIESERFRELVDRCRAGQPPSALSERASDSGPC